MHATHKTFEILVVNSEMAVENKQLLVNVQEIEPDIQKFW